jgi:hypothetical protein
MKFHFDRIELYSDERNDKTQNEIMQLRAALLVRVMDAIAPSSKYGKNSGREHWWMTCECEYRASR